ncbi:hypothetical protein DL96DRAFT_1627488 [Flagelloscypha sp. PMI_526]|nr:hypothetical protein DL96DRAFT_1627488 [Flagelloscypha sp. PMI_526]
MFKFLAQCLLCLSLVGTEILTCWETCYYEFQSHLLCRDKRAAEFPSGEAMRHNILLYCRCSREMSRPDPLEQLKNSFSDPFSSITPSIPNVAGISSSNQAC